MESKCFNCGNKLEGKSIWGRESGFLGESFAILPDYFAQSQTTSDTAFFADPNIFTFGPFIKRLEKQNEIRRKCATDDPLCFECLGQILEEVKKELTFFDQVSSSIHSSKRHLKTFRSENKVLSKERGRINHERVENEVKLENLKLELESIQQERKELFQEISHLQSSNSHSRLQTIPNLRFKVNSLQSTQLDHSSHLRSLLKLIDKGTFETNSLLKYPNPISDLFHIIIPPPPPPLDEDNEKEDTWEVTNEERDMTTSETLLESTSILIDDIDQFSKKNNNKMDLSHNYPTINGSRLFVKPVPSHNLGFLMIL